MDYNKVFENFVGFNSDILGEEKGVKIRCEYSEGITTEELCKIFVEQAFSLLDNQNGKDNYYESVEQFKKITSDL